MSPASLEHSTDEYLRDAVLNAFAMDETVASFNLRVGVLNAVVHLGGSVPSLDAWAKAEQIAAGVPGVRGIVNRIDAPGAPNPSRTIHLDLSRNKKEGFE